MLRRSFLSLLALAGVRPRLPVELVIPVFEPDILVGGLVIGPAVIRASADAFARISASGLDPASVVGVLCRYLHHLAAIAPPGADGPVHLLISTDTAAGQFRFDGGDRFDLKVMPVPNVYW